MPAATFLTPHQPISLISLIDAGSSKQSVIDLDWDKFQASLDGFIGAIDRYTVSAKSEIANLATEYTTNIRDVEAQQEEYERRIQQERSKEAEMLRGLEHERTTIADLTASVQHLHATLNKVREQSAQVENELNAVKKEVNLRRNERALQGDKLTEMRSKDETEVHVMEEYLGFRVDGIDNHRLLMRFTLLDPTEPEKEFSLILDISQHDYQVPACSPPLSNLSELLADLNRNRDLSGFIKQVRKSFKALVPAPQAVPSKFDTLAGPGMRTPATGRTLSSRPAQANTAADIAMDSLAISSTDS